ncbi:BRO-N domain-containing protein [Pseudochrobactrum kiredjianiae]|uniref:BRO-N domain-containing protein n=1 Tax=Pseudochrobactrum kiredjianiae TaxID=386305 RepID=UPI0025A13EB0|nr:BRO family protein [Pseudochrobactrum kiredjianiae]MDM7850423.1 BRO family protein [Pseudochrobactrum kiredjianiae]
MRVVTIDDQPWFVAKDVCRVLDIKQTTYAMHALNTDQYKQVLKSMVGSTHVSFPNRGATCISEGGLNRLIMRSDKPEARPFQDWITDVVIPAIRKDGAYIMGEEKVVSGEMDEDEFVLKAMTILQGKVERLKLENAKQAQVITEMR